MSYPKDLNGRYFTRGPIILGGCPRSGTSLLLSILSACPNVYCIPEEAWAFYNTKHLDEFQHYLQKWLWPKIPPGTEHWYPRWCEKTPRNVLAFQNIIEYFGPDARLIDVIRDGRDVVTSRHPQSPQKYWVEDWMWVWYVKEGLRFAEHPQVLTIRYEHLVTDFETTIATVCEFINEKCTDSMLDWFNNTKIKTHSAWFGPVKPITKQSIGRGRDSNNDAVAKLMNNGEAVALLTMLGYI